MFAGKTVKLYEYSNIFKEYMQRYDPILLQEPMEDMEGSLKPPEFEPVTLVRAMEMPYVQHNSEPAASLANDSGIEYFVHLAARCRSEEAVFSHTHLSKERVGKFFEACCPKYLCLLDLSNSEISDQHCKIISESYLQLEIVKLNNCHCITNDGLVDLIQSSSLPYFHTLELKNNSININLRELLLQHKNSEVFLQSYLKKERFTIAIDKLQIDCIKLLNRISYRESLKRIGSIKANELRISLRNHIDDKIPPQDISDQKILCLKNILLNIRKIKSF